MTVSLYPQRMKRRSCIPVLLMSLFWLVPAHAQTGSEPSSAFDLVRRVSENYRSLKSYRFEFTVVTEIKSRAGKKNVETEIEISLSRPDKARVLLNGGLGELQLVSDGVTTWSFLPPLNQYTRRAGSLEQPGDGTARGRLHFDSLASELRGHYEGLAEQASSASLLRKETLILEKKSIECLVVRVEPGSAREHSGQTISRTYWIDPERLLVLKRVRTAQALQPAGDFVETQVTTTFRKVSLNEDLPASHFVFQPPEGVREVAEFRPPQSGPPEAGTEAADFKLEDLGGREVHLEGLRGNVVLLNFWASWCGPCRLEMPVIEKLHREYKDRHLKVFGVNDEDIETIQEYVEERGYTFPTLVDAQQKVMTLYRVRGIPTMVVIDRDGKISHYRLGLSHESELRSWLKKAGVE